MPNWPTPQNTLEICERIAHHQNEIIQLETQLFAMTGKTHEEFLAGMRLLFAELPASPTEEN